MAIAAAVSQHSTNDDEIRQVLRMLVLAAYPKARREYAGLFPPITAFEPVVTNDPHAYLLHCQQDARYASEIITLWEEIAKLRGFSYLFKMYEQARWQSGRVWVGLGVRYNMH